MALDGIYLNNITREITDSLIGDKVNKISHPEKDMVILSFRGREKVRLLLSSNSSYGRVHFTNIKRENPKKAPLYLMVLRKHLQGAVLNKVVQKDGDRIINLYFTGRDELGYDTELVLSTEIMGKHSNIILIDNEKNVIIDAVKHVPAYKNSYRTLLPGRDYKAPPESNKLDPISYEDSDLLERNPDFNLDERFIMKNFNGISKKTSKYIYDEYKDEKDDSTKEDLLSFIRCILKKLAESDEFFIFLDDDNEYMDIASYPFYKDNISFDSPSVALEEFIKDTYETNRIKSRTQNLHKIITNNIDRVSKKIRILENTIKDSLDMDEYKLKGELLTSNIHSIEENQSEVTLLNYYNNEMIDIQLQKDKSLSDNIQRYYSRYNKKKRAKVMAGGQLILAKEELSYLTSILLSLPRLEKDDDIEDIKDELKEAGYIKSKRKKGKKKKVSQPMHFKSTEGIDIFVGKNNTQNDYLTTKFAHKEDTWLHTKDIPGSHVIIKSNNFSDETLKEAANLAAFYSRGKDSSKVPVDYTEVKYVKKPSGSKPGMVIYQTNKTILIDPERPSIKRIV